MPDSPMSADASTPRTPAGMSKEDWEILEHSLAMRVLQTAEWGRGVRQMRAFSARILGSLRAALPASEPDARKYRAALLAVVSLGRRNEPMLRQALCWEKAYDIANATLTPPMPSSDIAARVSEIDALGGEG